MQKKRLWRSQVLAACVAFFGLGSVAVVATAHAEEMPEEVGIGLKIDQIATINQKDKNFTVVGTLRIDWKNSQLSFEPEPGEPEYRTYRGSQFLSMITDKSITWPAISLFNQQERLAIHNEIVY